jgi:hypothetical protein
MGWMGVQLKFDSWWRQEIFLSSKASSVAMVATHAPVLAFFYRAKVV